MGCLNSTKDFKHWFGNIHLSGPCNRSCYFCIGQHMMELDALNTLDSWPLPGITEFVDTCRARGIKEINLTGTNTDPLLYKHHQELAEYLRGNIEGAVLGMRTNAVKPSSAYDLYDKGSVTVCSFNPAVYKAMMGQGAPPDLSNVNPRTWKVNVVLGPENAGEDLLDTLYILRGLGFTRVNLREPYGQPHVGNPLTHLKPSYHTLGMPTYQSGNCSVTYWDVHYVEVESVNLYANGTVSDDYPITRGHSKLGVVQEQSSFPGGRVRSQWL